MKKAVTGLALTAAAIGLLGAAGEAGAKPSSVQREGGPCHDHERGMDSADGKLYCSAVGMGNHWTTKKTHWPTITTSQLNTPCPKLGARARVYATDGVAICLQTPQGLRWRW
uniref:hypothetical protein n=1 Tax=Gordonia sp. B7-2 TaxID=3420932 RepID=UPI003D8E42FA